jgi:uncharacterized protein (TIGR02271 family)
MRDQIREGMSVKSSDGTNLGKVVALESDHFVIEKGFFFPKDYLVRYADVVNIDADTIQLSLDSESLRRVDEGVAATGEGSAASGREGTGGLESAEATDRSVTADKVGAKHEETRIPVAEEKLTATKRAKEAGRVRVKKDVVTEEKQITVPVTKEEVHVERVPASGDATSADFKEGTVDIPVMEEEVDIQKRPVIREEVRIGKELRQEDETASAEVRREEVDVDTSGTVSTSEDELRP